MPIRRALVVDDSRTARVILRRMLEQYNLVVDTAESAEDALDYLTYERPSVIFMDHMMPGMDGFQAVKAIKNDPNTAMIPIMMYTSKGGEVYLGEARALGAVGVLSKQVQPVELFQVLQRLHLLEQEAKTAPLAGPSRDSVIKFPKPTNVEYLRTPPQSSEPDELKGMIRRLLEEQRGKLKQDLLHSLEAGAPSRPGGQVSWRGREGAIKWTLIAASFFMAVGWYLSLRAEVDDTVSVAENPARNPATPPAMAAAIDQSEGERLRQALKAETAGTDKEKAILYDAIEWAINTTGEYGFNALALDDERLDVVYELVSRLAAVGFEGTLRIGVHGGQFCLNRNEFGGYEMPAADTPMGACEIIDAGVPPAVADLQSVAFANFLTSSPLVNGRQIDVQIVSHGHSRPLFGYPRHAGAQTAGEWNRIAQRNNRVELSIVPASR